MIRPEMYWPLEYLLLHTAAPEPKPMNVEVTALPTGCRILRPSWTTRRRPHPAAGASSPSTAVSGR